MVLTRSEYLKNPELWKGTEEEKELVLWCTDYIINKPNFLFDFSPIIVEIKNNKVIYRDNFKARKNDIFFVKLSKEVLKVYKNGRKDR